MKTEYLETVEVFDWNILEKSKIWSYHFRDEGVFNSWNFKYFVHSGFLSKVLLFQIPDDISQVPVSLQYIKPVADRANPKMGIGMLAFSPDNCFLATKNGKFLPPYIEGETYSLYLCVFIKEMRTVIGSVTWHYEETRGPT